MQKKPNILILFTDQQRYDTIGKAGYPYMVTPNLDRLAQEGCVYRNAHSTNPVCMPARHDLLTGLPGKAHGYFGNDKHPIKDYSLPTLPRILSENGYRTAAIGKMHFYPARMHHGFGEMYLMEELPECRQDDQYASFLKEEGLGHIQNLHGVRPHIYHTPQNSQMDEVHHGTTWVANKTVEWIKENKNNPFFVMASWIAPHPPWHLPGGYRDIYQDQELPEPVKISRSFPFRSETCDWYGDENSAEAKRAIREAYYASITMVDKYIGKVLECLEAEGILDDTLIIFTSDHGEMLQDKGFYTKQLPYEGSVRVPLIVRYPEKFKKGTFKEEFADLFDILPTCLDVCGVPYSSSSYELPGESLCSDTFERDREYQIASSGKKQNRWVMCRSQRFKYVYWYNGGVEELFDMVKDPGETVNLLKVGGYSDEEYTELKRRTLEYEKKWGPEGTEPDGNLKCFDAKEFHPEKCSKHSFWQNAQMQYFDDRCSQDRAEAFNNEIEHAVKDNTDGTNELGSIFNNKEWEENFMKSWEKYGFGEDIRKKLFP